MLHVGNDIVDLNTRGTTGRTLDRRFVDRVLTSQEKEALSCHNESADTLLWAFWAAKETAFKAVNKTSPDISSAPRRYCVSLDSNSLKPQISGYVKTPAGSVAVTISIQNSHIHCVGTTGSFKDLDRVFYGIKKIESEPGAQLLPDQQSFLVRKLAKEKIARHFSLDIENIDILRNRQKNKPGPPVIYFNSQESGMDISLSHHGQYVAFAAFDMKKE